MILLGSDELAPYYPWLYPELTTLPYAQAAAMRALAVSLVGGVIAGWLGGWEFTHRLRVGGIAGQMKSSQGVPAR